MTAVPADVAAEGRTLRLREATAADDAALVALAASCTMDGDVALRVDRAPSFLALNRLEGGAWRVAVVVNDARRVLGCVAVARRVAWVNGRPEVTAYAGDLKVHPEARGSGVADMLSCWAREASTELCGRDAPVVITVLGGNARMEHRLRGPRGSPSLDRFATVAAVAVPLLWERRTGVAGLRVRAATAEDLMPMAERWRDVGARRQLAPLADAAELAAWIARAPGLHVSDYLLAHDARGRLIGFVGVWDQSALKQMRVVGYSPRLALARRAINLAAPLAGAPGLPAPGGVLPALAAVHLCAREPAVLRALLLAAYGRHRGGRHALLTLGLDVRDPLLGATRGLLAQSTLVHAYVADGSTITAAALAARPLHHETALV